MRSDGAFRRFAQTRRHHPIRPIDMLPLGLLIMGVGSLVGWLFGWSK